MVRITEMTLNPQDKTAAVALFADAKSDVTDDMVVPGLPSGYSIGFGSSVLTAACELAFRKSDGTWSWS